MTFVELNISDTSVIKLGNRVANGVVVPLFYLREYRKYILLYF